MPGFEQFNDHMFCCSFLHVSCSSCFLKFLDLRVYSFHQIQKKLAINFFIGIQLLYNVVLVSSAQQNQSAICMHMSSLSLAPPSQSVQVTTEHRAELPTLYRRFLLATCFSHGSAYYFSFQYFSYPYALLRDSDCTFISLPEVVPQIISVPLVLAVYSPFSLKCEQFLLAMPSGSLILILQSAMCHLSPNFIIFLSHNHFHRWKVYLSQL